MGFEVDPDLVAAARSNRDALDRLLEIIWPEIYRVCVGIMRDRTAAEDAAQESCAAIARSLASLKSDDAFYGWMYTIAGRCAVRAEKQRFRERYESLPERAQSFDPEPAIDLRAALRRLSLIQRSCIVLHYFAGLSSSEIANALGMASPTVRFHLMLGRRALRASLSDALPVTEIYKNA